MPSIPDEKIWQLTKPRLLDYWGAVITELDIMTNVDIMEMMNLTAMTLRRMSLTLKKCLDEAIINDDDLIVTCDDNVYLGKSIGCEGNSDSDDDDDYDDDDDDWGDPTQGSCQGRVGAAYSVVGGQGPTRSNAPPIGSVGCPTSVRGAFLN